ncbi:MAG: hypothetical protein BRD55_07800 [Bacteroidetes bacterium SW_9_63_38]|nr:MAG: hypothetical protein BRD55_07800 [Bacteroidetes bacterium SW_9_63_38]
MLRQITAALLFVIAVGGEAARAQNNQFTERSFLSSPVVLGMGDAGVALPGPEREFFYNPAHLPHVGSHFTIFGLQGGGSTGLREHIRFLNQQVGPAAGRKPALEALQADAAQLQSRPGRGVGVIQLPNFVYAPGALALGGGLFAKTAANYRMEAAGPGASSVWVLNRTDLMALMSVGLNLRIIGMPGLSVGGTGTQTRRYLAFKGTALAQLEQQEPSVGLQGGVFQLDGGVTYRIDRLVSMPGQLRLGGAVYDVLQTGYDYRTGGAARLPFLNDVIDVPNSGSGPPRTEVQRARDQFALRPSYRIGAAYTVSEWLFLEDVALAADYQGYRGTTQALLARTHAGVEAQVVGPLVLRGGLSAGYPSGGAGLELGALHLDYSLHGVEEGEGFRQRRAYVHTARLLLRLE